jgi:hypothetical protein
MAPIIAVFGSSTVPPDDPRFDEGIECGRLLAGAGYAVATGGYGGVMEAVSRGASEAGGVVYGVTAPESFPDRPGANAYVAEEIPAPTITERIHRMISLADGFIALEGSIGTLTELVMAWNVAYVDRLAGRPAKPVAAVGNRWADVVTRLVPQIATDGDLVACVPTAGEAVGIIRAAVAPRP